MTKISTKREKSELGIIASRIELLRKEKGYSNYEHMAFSLGISRSAYHRLASGENFTIKTLIKICELLGVTLEDFFCDIKFPIAKKEIVNNIKIPILKKDEKIESVEILKKLTDFDITKKLKNSIRCHIKQAHKFNINLNVEEILGCSLVEFKKHLESKFEPWMNWENYGAYKKKGMRKWNIDHIIPKSYAKTEEEYIRLNHYINLRPFCSKKNSEKQNKIY